jgi:Ras-related protein Rab-21
VRSDLVIAIAANKSDLDEFRKIPLETAKEYATSIDALLFETSAKDDKGIEDLFLTISRKLIEKHAQKMPSSTAVVSTTNSSSNSAIDLDSKSKKKKSCCNV